MKLPTTNSSTWWLHHLGWATLLISLVLVFLQGLHPAWRNHAMVDSYFVYYDRAHYFLTHGNLTELRFNEYQPGAIFYFVALAPSLLWRDNRDFFVLVVMLSNVALLGLYGWLLKRLNHPAALLVLAVLIAATGPLLLLRFEVFCHVWVALALWAWAKGKHPFWAGASLGIATMTKVYPVFLLPLLVWFLPTAGTSFWNIKSSLWRWRIVLSTGFVTGLAAVTLAYMALFQVGVGAIFANAEVHAHKPVHFESVLGSATMAYTFLFQQRAPRAFASLIHGIDIKEYGWLGNGVHYLWLVPVALTYFLLWQHRHTRHQLSFLASSCIALLVTFLLFVSQLGPQYLLWFSLLVPMVSPPSKTTPRKWYLVALTSLVLSLIFTQFVFPLWYSELLSFFTTGKWNTAMTVFLLRNGALIIFGISWWKYWFSSAHHD